MKSNIIKEWDEEKSQAPTSDLLINYKLQACNDVLRKYGRPEMSVTMNTIEHWVEEDMDGDGKTTFCYINKRTTRYAIHANDRLMLMDEAGASDYLKGYMDGFQALGLF